MKKIVLVKNAAVVKNDCSLKYIVTKILNNTKSHRQAVVTNLGDHRRRHFKRARERRIIFQTQVLDEGVQQSVRVVLQQIIGVRIAVHINANLVCHDVLTSYCELCLVDTRTSL